MRRDSSTILTTLRAARRLPFPLSQRETHLSLRAEVVEGSSNVSTGTYSELYIRTLLH